MPNLSILNKDIRTLDGLYSLNDLHKASGGLNKHKPSLWANNKQTKDLIEEIEKAGIPAILKKQGLGTFVCMELVCDYASWISAKFHLHVIRVFLGAKTAEPQPTLDKLSTVETRVPLKDAVNRLVATKKVPYNVAWKMVHQREGVEHASELTDAQVKDALQYVHELTLSNVLEGELLPKDETPKLPELPEGHVNIPFNMQKNADYMVRVREGKASRKQLLYCANPQDEQQDWWLEA